MSNLEQRADSAAEALKAKMGLPQTKVQAGTYANQEPPQGSYAAQALQKQREAQQREQMQDLQRIPQNPTNPGEAPAQLPTDAIASPPDAPPNGAVAEGQELSPRANERIAELARQRKDFEQRAALADAERQRLTEHNQRLEAEFQSLRDEYHKMLQANLDHLDPDDRARVMAEANARQVAESVEQRILEKMKPIMDSIQQNNFQMELQRLAARYPSFDVDAHAQDIEAFISRNPSLTVEQAFRALASDEELQTTPASQVPHVVDPRGTRGTSHIAEPPPKDPDLDLVEERNQWKDLARSRSPDDQRQASRMLHDHLKKRLGLSGP